MSFERKWAVFFKIILLRRKIDLIKSNQFDFIGSIFKYWFVFLCRLSITVLLFFNDIYTIILDQFYFENWSAKLFRLFGLYLCKIKPPCKIDHFYETTSSSVPIGWLPGLVRIFIVERRSIIRIIQPILHSYKGLTVRILNLVPSTLCCQFHLLSVSRFLAICDSSHSCHFRLNFRKQFLARYSYNGLLWKVIVNIVADSPVLTL